MNRTFINYDEMEAPKVHKIARGKCPAQRSTSPWSTLPSLDEIEILTAFLNQVKQTLALFLGRAFPVGRHHVL